MFSLDKSKGQVGAEESGVKEKDNETPHPLSLTLPFNPLWGKIEGKTVIRVGQESGVREWGKNYNWARESG